MAIEGGLRVGELGVTLIVNDVEAAARFYADVLGAQELGRHASPIPGDIGGPQVHSVEMRLAGTFLVVARENPRWREAPRPDWPRAPISAGAASAAFTLYVDDVDATLAHALAAGASPQTASGATPEDAYWGDRVAQIHDPFGHVWRIQTRHADVAPEDLPARFAAHLEACRTARPTKSATGDHAEGG